MATKDQYFSLSPTQAPLGSHLGGPFSLEPVGIWFYREPTWLSRGIRLLGNRFTHVTARVGSCVFEQKLNRPTGWYSVDLWDQWFPPKAKIEWHQWLHVDLIDYVCQPGLDIDLWGTCMDYFRKPVYPTAQNCLSGPRNLLRIAGRNCDAVSPDALYRQALDLRGTVLSPNWLPEPAHAGHAGC